MLCVCKRPCGRATRLEASKEDFKTVLPWCGWEETCRGWDPEGGVCKECCRDEKRVGHGHEC